MSDRIKHECGIVLIRLLKPLEYYQEKYGTWLYGLNKLYLLMEKQRNRGQDGAGVVNVKFEPVSGEKYFNRYRSIDSEPIRDIFRKIRKELADYDRENPDKIHDPFWAKEHLPMASELYLGHLRYGTYGKNNLDSVHPVMRQNNWRSKNLVMAGNFNLTNVPELIKSLINIGQHPVDFSDTVTILENVGHFLDEENQKLFEHYKNKGYTKKEISPLIAQNLDVANVLRAASKRWDGGYVIGGIIGHGDAFVLRDPAAIRPAFYYYDDEIAVVASERPVIQMALNVPYEKVQEVERGHAIIIKKDGRISCEKIKKQSERKACSFERIYFSRGSDKDIYKERKLLGELLTPQIMQAVRHDVENTVLSFIPNTAEMAFYGMVKGVEDYINEIQVEKLMKLEKPYAKKELKKIVSLRPRIEKVAIKDVKLRTFISQDSGRNDLVAHVYDIAYGTIKKEVDNLVVIDDSIVRGTTLKESIIKILSRLKPKKIVIASSSPQIRYPDCYGIDMAKLSDFIAFQAAVALLQETKQQKIIDEVYQMSKAQINFPLDEMKNHVKRIYKPFTTEQISKKITQLLTPPDVTCEVEIVYQSIENLHKACPKHLGDWYFSGNYPTPGGNKVVSTSFINYIEKSDKRAY